VGIGINLCFQFCRGLRQVQPADKKLKLNDVRNAPVPQKTHGIALQRFHLYPQQIVPVGIDLQKFYVKSALIVLW
jgi:hypothetical protein